MKNYAAAPGGRVSKYGMTVSLLATQIEAIDKLTLEMGEGRSAVVRMLISEALALREEMKEIEDGEA